MVCYKKKKKSCIHFVPRVTVLFCCFMLGSVTTWTYEEWNKKIQNSFEKYFWIPVEKNLPNQVESHPELINRRGIYKDSVGATNNWPDYQLRCNYPVAMVVVS